jgi:predicted amidohydrolase
MSDVAHQLTVYGAQWQPGLDVVANLDQIASAVRHAHGEGANLVVFPEYAHTFGPNQGSEWVSRAEELDGSFVSALSGMSDQAEGLLIIAGMLQRAQAEKPHNTLVCVHDTGVVGVCQKIHLYDAFGNKESEWLTPASISDPDVVAVGPWRIGMQTCYDLRFPEVTRRLVDAGTNVIVIPAQWVPGPHKLEQWRALLTARAIESQSYVVAIGQPAPSGVGHSMVVSPRGVVIAEAAETPGNVVATLEWDEVETAREENPMAQARRFGVVWKK